MEHSPPKKKIRSPLAQKLLVGLKRIMQNGTDSLYLHAKFSKDPPLHGGVRNKSWVFLFCFFLFVTLCILNRG